MVYSIRQATSAEIELMGAQRRAMFLDMGLPDDAKMAAMSPRFAAWALAAMAEGRYRTWFAVFDSEVVGGAAVWLKPQHPGTRTAQDFVAYVLNVYVAPSHRSKRVARQLIEHIVAWCRVEKIEVVELHASDQGRALYESMGFEATNEMRLKL